jgi:hypothetical protein
LNVSDLLADPDLIHAFRAAYDESGFGTDVPTEQGGFILMSPHTAKLEIVRLPPGERDSLTYPVCPDGRYEGKQIIGTFHTHPNTGAEWRQEPSPQDIRLSQDYPETMGAHQFVISSEKVYHIDNEGIVFEAGSTGQLLGL